MMSNPVPAKLPSPFAVGLAGTCPRCGKGRLFKGFLSLEERCANCGLDFAFADSGDGPAIFIMFAVGFIVISAAAVVDATIHPPPYVHLMLWIPATVILALLLLRPFKATMVALQYRNRATEMGRREIPRK
jgi:uncharacterized protein (DUF983 family)